MRSLKKGQHIFIAFQNGKAVLDSQLRPRIYTSLKTADRWTPTVNKGKIEYVEYAPTLTPQNEPLTIEQLRQMDGQPVWVKQLKDLSVCDTGWALMDICPDRGKNDTISASGGRAAKWKTSQAKKIMGKLGLLTVARRRERRTTMPKYKSPDGRVYNSIQDAIYGYCRFPNGCAECGLCDMCYLPMDGWTERADPKKTAYRMGYEIIEDGQEAKADGGKPRPSLVQPALIRADMATREFGCAKYHDPDNWRNVEAARYWDALLRHVLAAWDDWRAVDPESGLPHLHHIICNAGFLAQYMEDGNG